jgi:hypothetical protein
MNRIAYDTLSLEWTLCNYETCYTITLSDSEYVQMQVPVSNDQ